MKILKFFDKLEDKIRFTLSKRPFIYTFIGGVAIVLFWRGVWMTADMFQWLTGPLSLLISTLVLLLIGLFVSFFIGEQEILHGLKREKKLIEKTKEEINQEEISLRDLRADVHKLLSQMEKLAKEHEHHLPSSK